MPGKKATKTANAVATIYEGAFDVTFDCVGTMVCKYAMCSEMPVDGSEECFFRDHGSCRHPAAQQTTMEILINRLNKDLKQLKEDSES